MKSTAYSGKSLLLLLALLAGVASFSTACEERSEDSQRDAAPQEGAKLDDQSLLLPADEEGGGFFDEGLLLDGALNIADQVPECVGASPEELERPDHPQIIRGYVLAPSARFARRPTLFDWIIPSAYAAPLDGEGPVPNVRVALYEQEKGEPSSKTIIETRTNVAGAWCMRIPDGYEPGTNLMLVATHRDARHRLRRLFALPGDVDISALSEAFVQILSDEDLDAKSLPRATYLNLEVLSSTALDLLTPIELVEEDRLRDTVLRIKKVLRQDPRFSALLARQLKN